MRLKKVLERLRKTIKLSKKLKDEQFNYKRFVTEFDYENNCGTVCCIAGHYPNWGIDILKYDSNTILNITPSDTKCQLMSNIKYQLEDYHGLSGELISALFYGRNIDGTFTDELVNHEDLSLYSLQEVIERFETVYQLLENKTIKPNWNSYDC